jgi:hypothetical protein
LREKSKRSYDEHRPQYLAAAAALGEAGALTPEDLRKLSTFLSDDFEHGLWHRIRDGISSCTNHAERFHGVVNNKLARKPHTPQSFVIRLAAVRDCIHRKWKNYGEGRPRQIRHVLFHLRSCRAPQVSECLDPDCLDYQVIMASRYGLGAFPCRHTIGSWDQSRITALPAKPQIVRPASTHTSEIVELRNGFPPAFQRKPGRPADLPRPGVQCDVAPWDDAFATSGPEPPVVLDEDVGEAWERRDQQVVRTIYEGVRLLQKHAPVCPGMHKHCVLVSIWEDLRITSERLGPDADRPQLVAECTARWWSWAKGLSPRPIDPHGWSHRPHVERARRFPTESGADSRAIMPAWAERLALLRSPGQGEHPCDADLPGGSGQ